MLKDLGNKPLVVIIGLIASCLAIFTFVSGRQSLASVINNGNDTPTPLPTPTETLVPYIQTLIVESTQYVTEMEALAKSDPATWLPDQKYIPTNLRMTTDESLSNESAANITSDPVTMFENFAYWGRISGHRRTYFDELGCDARIGLAYIDIQTSLYKTLDGAYDAYDFYQTILEDDAYLTFNSFSRTTYEVGDYAYMFWTYERNTCTQEKDGFRMLRLIFNTKLAFVQIESAVFSYTMDDDKLGEIVLGLAKNIDLNLLEEMRYK